MPLVSRSLQLPNGLQLQLIHQPDASRAAALVQVATGSHHEPARWPGLAHLLEHLLFTGSRAFADEQRLMPWIQGQGGRVNATTLQQRTAFFFEVAAPQLADGLSRLTDMLTAPLFTPAAIAQEVAVIDAEYQLLQRHTPTLCEAALLSGVTQPSAFQRFQVGSRAHFGDDIAALRAALFAFHQRDYRSANMQLWLQGPQSLDQLEQMARRACAQLPAGGVSVPPGQPQLAAVRDCLLRIEGAPHFWLSYLLPGAAPDVGDSVTLLREFALDDAPGGLLSTLRDRGLCDRLSLQWLYLSDRSRWLVLQFEGETLTPAGAQATETLWHRWLQALARSTPVQRSHYGQLAAARFARLTPLDQLRERAFGFAPGASDDLNAFIAALGCAPVTRLFAASDVQGDTASALGFRLQRCAWHQPPMAIPAAGDFYFHPLPAAVADPPLPSQTAPLLHCHAQAAPNRLLLRPAFGQTFSPAEGTARAARLRPLFATLRHLGGEGEFSACEGVWQLQLRLPAQQGLWAVRAALDGLMPPLSHCPEPEEEEIAIRALLAELPQQLASSTAPDSWCAALSGGDKAFHQAVSRLLSAFPVCAASAALPAAVKPSLRRIRHRSAEQALLLFVPLPDQDATTLAAARALALLYEPRFFRRLRTEQQIGYVVNCRYLRSADRDGIVFLLQSPDCPPARLLRHCKNFLRDVSGDIDALSDELFSTLQARLRQLMSAQEATEALRTALRREAGLPELTQAAIGALTPAGLRQLHQQVLRSRRRWQVLFCGGRMAPAKGN